MPFNSRSWRRRAILVAMLPALLLAGPALQPTAVMAQDPPVEELNIATWVEDVSRLIRPLRQDAIPDFALPEGESGGGGPVWEDAAPLYEEWTCDAIVDVLLERFDGTKHFAVVTLEGTGQLVITAPAESKAAIHEFMNRFRQMSMALTRVQITPLQLGHAAYAELRQKWPASVADDPTALLNWLSAKEDAGDASVGGTAQGEMRNGEQVAISQVSERNYVRDLDVQTAINASALDPEVDVLRTGWGLQCTPWVVRDGTRVLVELHGGSASADEPESHEFANGASVQLPLQHRGDIHAAVLGQPGKVYIVSAGPRPTVDQVSAFLLEVVVIKKRPAEMPGERKVKGLLTRRYDVWELCLPWRNTEATPLRADRSVRFNDYSNEEQSEPLYYDDVTSVFSELCPDWDIVGARESYLELAGAGYVELVNTPKAHESMRRALTALLQARPRSLATDIVAWKLTREQFDAVPGLRRGAQQPVTPEALAAAVPEDERQSARLIDTTVWHLEGQLQAATLVDSQAYVADYNVQAQQDVSVFDPVIGVAHTGHSLALKAVRGDDDDWEITSVGTLATLHEMAEQSARKDGSSDGETLQQPRLGFVDLGGRATVRPGQWSVRLLGSPDDDGYATVLMIRTRVVAE
ncbi:MAG: hypothetical protein AB7K09_09885 [Planctomycetota bacterium]